MTRQTDESQRPAVWVRPADPEVAEAVAAGALLPWELRPHFVFNALNSIATLTRKCESDRAQQCGNECWARCALPNLPIVLSGCAVVGCQYVLSNVMARQIR